MRAAAVGLDPWRLVQADVAPDERILTEALVQRLEANQLAKVKTQATETGRAVVEGMAALFEVMGLIERRRG